MVRSAMGGCYSMGKFHPNGPIGFDYHRIILYHDITMFLDVIPWFGWLKPELKIMCYPCITGMFLDVIPFYPQFSCCVFTLLKITFSHQVHSISHHGPQDPQGTHQHIAAFQARLALLAQLDGQLPQGRAKEGGEKYLAPGRNRWKYHESGYI